MCLGEYKRMVQDTTGLGRRIVLPEMKASSPNPRPKRRHKQGTKLEIWGRRHGHPRGMVSLFGPHWQPQGGALPSRGKGKLIHRSSLQICCVTRSDAGPHVDLGMGSHSLRTSVRLQILFEVGRVKTRRQLMKGQPRTVLQYLSKPSQTPPPRCVGLHPPGLGPLNLLVHCLASPPVDLYLAQALQLHHTNASMASFSHHGPRLPSL